MKDVFAKVEVWQVVFGLFVGVVMATTQIVPGLSASAFLMAIGWFTSVMDSISFTYWQSNPQVFFVYFSIGIGFLIGLFTLSKLLTNIFAKARHTAYSMIVGLSLGSILSMFCNGDIVEVYLSWANGMAVSPILDIVLGIVLFALGVISSYLLVRYQRKKDEESALKQEDKE